MKYTPGDRESQNVQDTTAVPPPTIQVDPGQTGPEIAKNPAFQQNPMDLAWLINLMMNPGLPQGQPAPGIIPPPQDALALGSDAQGAARYASPSLGLTNHAAPAFDPVFEHHDQLLPMANTWKTTTRR